MHLWQKFKAFSVVCIDIGIADFAIQGVIAEEKMNAVDVLPGLGILVLLGMIFFVVLFESIFKGSTDIHDLAGHSHIFLVFIYLRIDIPLLNSSFKVIFLAFLLPITLDSI